jgi:hypothetical protein
MARNTEMVDIAAATFAPRTRLRIQLWSGLKTMARTAAKRIGFKKGRMITKPKQSVTAVKESRKARAIRFLLAVRCPELPQSNAESGIGRLEGSRSTGAASLRKDSARYEAS